MHRAGNRRNKLAILGLLLSLVVTPLWAGEMAQHELLDGLLSLQLPEQMVVEFDDQPVEDVGRVMEFRSSDDIVGVTVIQSPVPKGYADSLQALHDDVVSGGEHLLLRDEWHGVGEARYFIVEGPVFRDERAAAWQVSLVYATQANDQLLAVIVSAAMNEWEARRPTARAIIDSISVNR